MTIFSFFPKINIFAFLNEIFSLLHSSLKLKFIKNTPLYFNRHVCIVFFFKLMKQK